MRGAMFLGGGGLGFGQPRLLDLLMQLVFKVFRTENGDFGEAEFSFDRLRPGVVEDGPNGDLCRNKGNETSAPSSRGRFGGRSRSKGLSDNVDKVALKSSSSGLAAHGMLTF